MSTENLSVDNERKSLVSTGTEATENELPIVVVKIATGQELVGKVIHEDQSNLLLQSPLMIQIVKEGNTYNMALFPFSFAGKQDQVLISKLHVVAMMEPDPQFATQYSANLAGITLAPASNGPKITLN